ncbi:MAG: SDR family NAD(P)-dependent oxidoreductase [Anaerolineaceae bacterium]|nr:SDR family NAD(P)-dependent oxidoreductase [Anaerolineaceae bacterium]
MKKFTPPSSYVLITGATGGLGGAFALECARRGFNLVLSDLHPRGYRLAEYLQAQHGIDARYYACDLTNADARADFYQSLADDGLRFWSLINVAGLDHEGGVLERKREQLLQIVRLNIENTLDTTLAILQLRDEEQKFRLINVSSMASFYPMPYKAVYAASKRFLLDLSLALAEEIHDFGTVTALCPAGMPTTPETMRAIFSQGFWGRMTTINPDQVAAITLRKALRGRRVVVPGWINQWIVGLSSIVPQRMKIHAVSRRWEQSRSDPLRAAQIEHLLAEEPVAKTVICPDGAQM